MYETFDHTADLGLRIRADDLPTLFAEAGQALLSVLIENPESVVSSRRHDIEMPLDDLDYLLFDWLKTLLLLFESEKFLGRQFEIQLDEKTLRATVQGETYDPPRHEPAHEVKAITYHDLKVEREQNGWLAEVIVDI